MTRKCIYLVAGSCGKYSDRTEWNVCAFTDEKKAQAFAVKYQQDVRSAAEIYHSRSPDYDLCDKKDEKLAAECDKMHSDPFISVRDYYARDASYYVSIVHLDGPLTREEWEAEIAGAVDIDAEFQ